MKLSILMPVYNESRTLAAIFDRLGRLRWDGIEVETICVDDASTDDSARILLELSAGHRRSVRIIRHERNLGKGAAVQTALSAATGDIVVIQDADLEYHPEDLETLLQPILDGRANVVFGSRNLTDNPRYSRFYYWGNLFLNACIYLIYGRYVSDMETCYKLMRRQILVDLKIQSRGFDMEPEITAKLIRMGHPILEMPIRYTPRSRAEGKKITIRDGIRALGAILYWRFAAL